MPWFESPLELMQVLTLVYNDLVPVRLDAVYPFAHTIENEEPIIHRAASFYGTRTERLLISGGGPYYPRSNPNVCGYAGGQDWRQQLVALGVPRKNITLLPRPRILCHTGTEAESLRRWVEKNTTDRPLDLGVTAASGHLLRAFTNTVSVFVKNPMECLPRIFAIHSEPLPWFEMTSWSQGDHGKTRVDALEDELGRLDRYYANGDLVSAEEILEYFKRRG